MFAFSAEESKIAQTMSEDFDVRLTVIVSLLLGCSASVPFCAFAAGPASSHTKLASYKLVSKRITKPGQKPTLSKADRNICRLHRELLNGRLKSRSGRRNLHMLVSVRRFSSRRLFLPIRRNRCGRSAIVWRFRSHRQDCIGL